MMAWWLIGTFSLLLSVSMGFSVYWYKQSVEAKNSALILARVMPNSASLDALFTQETPPERLAHSPRWQRWLKDAPFVGNIAVLLSQAGASTTVASFLGATLACACGCGVIANVAGCSTPAAGVAAIVGAGGPVFHFVRMRAKRVAAFEGQITQILEMVTLYLRSGRSLPQAFVATAAEAEAPAREELGLCAEEYRLGRPLAHALRGLAGKYPDLLGLKLMAIAISVLGQTGGNLVEVLDRIRHTLEQSMTFVLKLRAMTGESRNTATLLSATPGFSLLATAFLNPAYLNEFFYSLLGLIFFGAFVVLWVGGIVWLRIMMSSTAD